MSGYFFYVNKFIQDLQVNSFLLTYVQNRKLAATIVAITEKAPLSRQATTYIIPSKKYKLPIFIVQTENLLAFSRIELCTFI